MAKARQEAPLVCEEPPAQSVSSDGLGNSDRIAMLQEQGHLQPAQSLVCGPEDELGSAQFSAGLTGEQCEDVSVLPFEEKLSRVLGYTGQAMKGAFAKELAALFTPSAIAAMASFLALYIAAQATPAGWIADGIALASITLAVIFTGVALWQVLQDLGRFLSFPWAKSEADLQSSGTALAATAARLGVGLVVALLTKGLGKAARGSKMDGPPPTGMAEAVTPAGQIIRMPVPAAQAVVAAQPSVLVEGALLMVALPPTGGGSSGGGGGAPKKEPRGPEIWEEISNELKWAEEGQQSPGPAGALKDARELGLKPDVGVQKHGQTSKMRKELGVEAKDGESAHIGPTSVLKEVPGYSRSKALTTLLDEETHAAFDKHWLDWAREQTRTEVTVTEMRTVMQKAILKIPNLSDQARSTLLWLLDMELQQLKLGPCDMVRVPFSKK